MKLYIPKNYTPEDNCECGPTWLPGGAVRDDILGVSIKKACCIHDWMYSWKMGRKHSDTMFLHNIYVLIEEAGGPWWLKFLRKRIGQAYYLSVSIGGSRSY